jgi:hypothetical protein
MTSAHAGSRTEHPLAGILRQLRNLWLDDLALLSPVCGGTLAVCREGRRHYPQDVELRFHESIALKVLGDESGAEGGLLDLLYAHEVSNLPASATWP